MTSFEKLVHKYPSYVRNPSLCYIESIDGYLLPPAKQIVSNVEILTNHPTILIKFEKKDTVIALVITAYKISSGYKDFNNFECILNNQTLNSADFDIGSNDFMNEFDIDKIAHIIQEKDNTIIIKARNIKAFNSSQHNMISFGTNEDDYMTEAKRVGNEGVAGNNKHLL